MNTLVHKAILWYGVIGVHPSFLFLCGPLQMAVLGSEAWPALEFQVPGSFQACLSISKRLVHQNVDGQDSVEK